MITVIRYWVILPLSRSREDAHRISKAPNAGLRLNRKISLNDGQISGHSLAMKNRCEQISLTN